MSIQPYRIRSAGRFESDGGNLSCKIAYPSPLKLAEAQTERRVLPGLLEPLHNFSRSSSHRLLAKSPPNTRAPGARGLFCNSSYRYEGSEADRHSDIPPRPFVSQQGLSPHYLLQLHHGQLPHPDLDCRLHLGHRVPPALPHPRRSPASQFPGAVSESTRTAKLQRAHFQRCLPSTIRVSLCRYDLLSSSKQFAHSQ